MIKVELGIGNIQNGGLGFWWRGCHVPLQLAPLTSAVHIKYCTIRYQYLCVSADVSSECAIDTEK